MVKKQQPSINVKGVQVSDPFWSKVQTLVREVVIPFQKQVLEDAVPGVEKSHAVENFRIAAGEQTGEFYGFVFQDSDVAKWLEAVAYSLALHPDEKLEKEALDLIALVGRAQEPDGYLDTYFTVKEPDHKWQDLQECHELYCAGHMLEAAVAWAEAAGRTELLDIMKKNADLICSLFGKDKRRGYPGHEEIEMALIRLYRLTGEKKYLETAGYFLEERGTEPSYFKEEAENRGWTRFGMNPDDREYPQDHAPVKKQDKAVGHAVRAAYLYTAMADYASETGDEEMFAACKRLWRNIVDCRMYVTGGIGSTVHGEAFSADYELPNDLVYAETCASVAMAFFARRMLEIEANGEYADILEKELYNGILSGMQLDGRRFFYVNPLEVVPGVSGKLAEYKHVLPERPNWYPCACCPPNVARLVSSIGQYAWGENESTVFAHTYLGGKATFQNGAVISCESSYPWSGSVKFTMEADKEFTFALHIPSWCKSWSLNVSGNGVQPELRGGYAYLSRAWKAGDTVELTLKLEPRRIYANTNVRADAGCVALARGPIVYCFEEKDNGAKLSSLRVPRSAAISEEICDEEKLAGMVALTLPGVRMTSGSSLYSEEPPKAEDASLRAIPYFAWGNRGPGEMRVWLLEQAD